MPNPPPPSRLAALLSPAFLGTLALLLLNDFVLKTAFPGWVTGKLSDFAGLFAFAVFWSTLFPRFRAHAIAATAVGFALWKSPLAQPWIDGWNALPLPDAGRVVDWTDLAALAVLPLAYRHRPSAPRMPSARVLGAAAAVVSMFAFTATSFSVPPPPLVFTTPREYRFPLPRGELVKRIRAGSTRLDQPGKPVPDTVAAYEVLEGQDFTRWSRLTVFSRHGCGIRLFLEIVDERRESVLRVREGHQHCGEGEEGEARAFAVLEKVLIEPLGGVPVRP